MSWKSENFGFKLTSALLRFALGLFLSLLFCNLPAQAALTLKTPQPEISQLEISQLDTPPKRLLVTTAADSGQGSLRWAIERANLNPDANLIDLGQLNQPIRLRSSLPSITSDLTITGVTTTGTTTGSTISGEGSQRLLTIERGTVTLKHLLMADGLALGGAETAAEGAGLLINGGMVKLEHLQFIHNRAIGGSPTTVPRRTAEALQTRIQADKNDFDVNRGGIVGINGISLPNLDGLDLDSDGIRIDSSQARYRANRGAVAGVSGVGIGGIGSIAFAGGGGIGGLGNAGNGGDGGQGGEDGGDGGKGGNGGNGGIGLFKNLNIWDDQGGIGTAVFSGGSGFGGIGNAGNGGKGGIAQSPTAAGGEGGDGGEGGSGSFGSSPEPFWGNRGQIWLAGGSRLAANASGGAIFIRSGHLVLSDTRFEANQAIAAPLGQGKGGALYVAAGAEVIALDPPIFSGNLASQAQDQPADNSDIYGIIQVE